jgi:hypothetical protein
VLNQEPKWPLQYTAVMGDSTEHGYLVEQHRDKQ